MTTIKEELADVWFNEEGETVASNALSELLYNYSQMVKKFTECEVYLKMDDNGLTLCCRSGSTMETEEYQKKLLFSSTVAKSVLEKKLIFDR